MKLKNNNEPLSAADLWQIHGASATNILVGAWLLIAPWLLGLVSYWGNSRRCM